MPHECDEMLNLQPIIQQTDNEIDCGDLFASKIFSDPFSSKLNYFSSVGSAFDLTTDKPTTIDENIGNFDVTMDDIFDSNQSPTLQLTDYKSQPTKDPFDDDETGMNDDELLDAFNKHFESSPVNPSPVLVLTGKVQTQMSTHDLTLPRFDLEFSFDDLENSDEATKEKTNSSDRLQT